MISRCGRQRDPRTAPSRCLKGWKWKRREKKSGEKDYRGGRERGEKCRSRSEEREEKEGRERAIFQYSKASSSLKVQVPTLTTSPLLLVIIVHCINDIFFPILDNLPHGSPNHVSRSIGCDGQTMTLSCTNDREKNVYTK